MPRSQEAREHWREAFKILKEFRVAWSQQRWADACCHAAIFGLRVSAGESALGNSFGLKGLRAFIAQLAANEAKRKIAADRKERAIVELHRLLAENPYQTNSTVLC